MYVGRVMRKELVTVPPETPLAKAREILEAKSIAHLLVVDREGGLKGIISDRDIKQNWASPATSLSAHELNYLLDKVTVEMVMIKNIVTVSPDTTIERACHIMQTHRISALPVIENEKTAGIITATDVQGILMEAIGIDRGESTRFVVLMHRDRVGTVAEITRLLKEENISIRSLFAWPDRDHSGVHHLIMRVGATFGERAVEVLKNGGFKVLTGYIPDLTPLLQTD